MILSIVVPTKNRADKLDDLLVSISEQKTESKNWELIVIDNGSTDDTRNICDKWRNKFSNFRYIYDERPGLHIGRNRGLKESNGDVIAYLDDDILLFPHWIQTGIDAFEDVDLMAANGSVIPGDFGLISDYLWKYKQRINGFEVLVPISCYWERGITERSNIVRRQVPELLFGGNCFYRRVVLEECKGFHPDGMPNELMIYRGDGEAYVGSYLKKKHSKIMYYSQLSAYHMVDATRVNDGTIRKIQYRNGISNMYSILRNGKNHTDSLKKGLKQIVNELFDTELDTDGLYGASQLYLNYLIRPKIKRWVHKTDYF